VSLLVCICMTEYARTHRKSSSRWALCLPMTLPTTSSQYFYSEDSGPLGCEIALLGEWFPTFIGTTLLWKNGKHSTNTGSHARRLESSSIPLRLPHLTFIFFQMLHSTASIFSPTFQKYLNLILWEFFRNDVKVYMLYTCGRILVGKDYNSWNFIITQISTSTLTHTNLPNFSILSLQTTLMDVNRPL
jgi:hypothetical protein